MGEPNRRLRDGDDTELEAIGLKPGLKTAVPGAGVYGVVVTHEFHCMVSAEGVWVWI